MKPTKSGTGAYLPIRFSILEGQYKGQKLFVRLNLDNLSQQAKEIAFKELSAIGHAVGVLMIQQSEQLHNIPLWVRVKTRTGQKNEATGETYDDSNEISSYKDINFVPPAAASGAAAPAAVVVPPVAAPAAAFVPPAVTPPAPAAPAPAPVVAAPTYEMAPGETFTREQYNAAGWSDETLIAQNKMRVVQPAAPAPAAPPAPSIPVAPPSAPAAPGPGAMPWANAPAQPWTAPAANAPAAAAPAAPVTPPPPAAVAAQSAAPPWSAPKAA